MLSLLLAFALSTAAADVDAAEDSAVAPAAAQVVPPSVLETPSIAFPEGGDPIAEPVEVQVHLRIDAAGEVAEVTVVQGAREDLDRAVIDAAKAFRFMPATLGGEPIEVVVPFSHTFVPPPRPVADEAAPELDAVLEGVATVMGLRQPVANATIYARSEAGEWVTTTGEDGAFTLAVMSGELEVRVVASGHRKFVQSERLQPNQRLKVKYLVERESYGMYQSITRADRDRTEVSRTTLTGRELTRVAGTFGDPFKVMTVLPGVTSVMGLLPLPVVRGSSPGNTGIFLDNVRLPLLFHLLAGPSVVHPEFIDRVDFYPGGFPVSYGGYTGGIVDGVTRSARGQESRLDIDVNLVQTGVFARQEVEPLDMTASVAGRIGYPGMLLSLATPDVSLSYWDYQARFDFGSKERSWSVFVFGAEDHLKLRPTPEAELVTALKFTFHRLDLRHRRGPDENHVTFRTVFGYDDSSFGPGQAGGPGDQFGSAATGSFTLNPQVRWHREISEALALELGIDGSLRRVETPALPIVSEDSPAVAAIPSGWLTVGGAFGEVVLAPTESLRIVPGVRADLYNQGSTTQWNVDPRIMARYRIVDGDVGGTWLKAVAGRYHQPPRLFIPIPGVDQSSLDLGLLASTQVSVGAETKIAQGIELDVQTYFNYMDPVVFELTVNRDLSQVQRNQPDHAPWERPPEGAGGNGRDIFADLIQRRVGRSYGVEVLLRKRDSERLFGWISYTLSRSERIGENGYEPFDFDRSHIFNLVVGIRLPRNWELGGRLLLQSGTPLTTIFGYNESRSDGQFRFDLRVDKRAVWKEWMLDFYVDVVNATVARESGGVVGGQPIRYIVPTIGVRAVL